MECCSGAKRTVVHTLTDRSLTHTHAHRDSLCVAVKGETRASLCNKTNICLDNLDVSGCTHIAQTRGLVHPSRFSFSTSLANFFPAEATVTEPSRPHTSKTRNWTASLAACVSSCLSG